MIETTYCMLLSSGTEQHLFKSPNAKVPNVVAEHQQWQPRPPVSVGHTDILGLDDAKSMDDVAKEILKKINPASKKEHMEYCGYICKAKWWDSYSATRPTQGGKAQCSPKFTCPFYSNKCGRYHTHGGNDPGFDNENFSESTDGGSSDAKIYESEKIPGYLMTPSDVIP